jgi:hypothetical protein
VFGPFVEEVRGEGHGVADPAAQQITDGASGEPALRVEAGHLHGGGDPATLVGAGHGGQQGGVDGGGDGRGVEDVHADDHLPGGQQTFEPVVAAGGLAQAHGGVTMS